MNNQSLFKVGHKLFKKDHPMNHKRGIIYLYAPSDVILDLGKEELELPLFNDVVKYLTIDRHFSYNNFLQYISDEFEKTFKRFTAQNSINVYSILSFVNYIILKEGMRSPEAYEFRDFFANYPKDLFVYNKLGITETELNTRLHGAVRRIVKTAQEKGQIPF